MKKLYNLKNSYGSLILLLSCIVVTVPTIIDRNLYYIFASSTKPFFIWQYFTGIFEHSISPAWFIYPHFLGNMSMLLVFGLLVESCLGTKKFLMITGLGALTNLLFFFFRNQGYIVSLSGASGMTYAYIPIAIYLVYRAWLKDRDLIKSLLFFIFILELVFSWVFITVNSDWDTNAYHLLASLVGVIIIVTDKKILRFDKPRFKSINMPSKITLGLMPLLLLSILTCYQFDLLDSMFVEPSSISDHQTITEVLNNNNRIEIKFDQEIHGYSNTSTSGYDKLSISISEDKKALYCDFDEGLTREFYIKLDAGKTADGRILKPIEMNIKEGH